MVGLSPIADVTLPAGTAIYVPLNGDDPGQTVNYAVTASDYSKVTTVVMPQTNKSLQFNVDIDGAIQSMDFQLFDNLAPNTASVIENLVLSEYYDGLSIYRNGKDQFGNPFVIQGGNNPPTGPIKENQPSMAEEFNPDLQYTSSYILAMARGNDPSSSSTEFFITATDARFLDYNYTMFGIQTEGTEVNHTIEAMPNQDASQDPRGLGYLVTPLTISSVSIFTDTQNGVLQLRAPEGVTGAVTITVTAFDDGTNTPAIQSFTVTIEPDDPLNPDNPFTSVIPATPASVAFLPPAGTGGDITNLNNSGSNNSLQFQVSGVTSGNDVVILADGNPLGHATATGTTVTVTTDGSTILTEGLHTITAIQIAEDQTVTVIESGIPLNKTADVPSLNSSAVTLTVDITPPEFNFIPITTAFEGIPYTCQVTTVEDAADGVTYQLTQAPTGMVIDSNTGVITWTPGAGFQSAEQVTVQAMDPAGNTASMNFLVGPNYAPVLEPANPVLADTDEDTPTTIPLTTFINNGAGTTIITDVDGEAGGIALTNATGQGTWEYSLDGTTFAAVGALADVSALLLPPGAQLRYTPDGENGEQTVAITYRAWDRTSGQDGNKMDTTINGDPSAFSTETDTASLTVTDVNDAPVLIPANPFLGNTTPSTPIIINLSDTFINNDTGTTTIEDVDQNATIGGIALIGMTGEGMWEYSTDDEELFFDPVLLPLSEEEAFLLDSSAKLRYTPFNQDSETATITYRAWDMTSGDVGVQPDTTTNGGTTAYSIATDTAVLTVNDAPILTPAGPSLGTTDEHTAITFSLTGTFINSGAGTTIIEDPNPNDATGGIALVGVVSNGTWEYSLDGTTFNPAGTIGADSALLLPDNAQLRYTPDGENGESAAITYRAWDFSRGANGDKVDTTINGGATAFSSETDTATFAVTDINDAPILTPASPSLGNVVLNTPNTISLTGTFINNGTGTTSITDVDHSAVVGGIALVGSTGEGTWEYALNGAAFTPLGTVSESSALLLSKDATLRYTAGGAIDVAATITYRAWDTTTGTSGDRVDLSLAGAVGDATAFSTATDTASFAIPNASVSGFVYVDSDNDGLRITPSGKTHMAIPGVTVMLLGMDDQGNFVEVADKSPVLTDTDGSYRFEGLVPGTYRIQELQLANCLDGKETVGKIEGVVAGTAGEDQFEIQLGPGEDGTEFNFGERGLRPDLISKRLTLTSAPPAVEFINAAPVVLLTQTAAGNNYRVTFPTDGSPVSIAAADATVTDTDSPILASLTVSIANPLDGVSETLKADVSSTPIKPAYADGVLTLSGPAELTVYQQVLRSLTYRNTAESPHAENRKIKIVANDGATNSQPATATVIMSPEAADSVFQLDDGGLLL